MKKILALMALCTIVGCAPSFTLKEAGKAKIWNSYTVAVVEDVNELKTDNSILWTKDGPILETIEFWKPLSPGDQLPLNFRPGSEEKVPEFREDMTPEEVVEFIRSSFSSTPLIPTNIDGLRPMDFGTKTGYLVDLELSSQKGDDFKSQILFTNSDGKLYALYLNGRATHYFEARKPVFDEIVSSIQF